jgi:tetratricopeptide (TPR) repeat protein
MTILPGIALYNQARQRDEDFIESFVARRGLLELLLNVLRKVARDGKGEHQLIVGQRGMGKSSLLRRVALGVKQDEELRTQFLPLQFREEQYNVNTLDVFWRNCGESLAQWCEENDRSEMAHRLDEAIENPEWRDSEKAASAFVAACNEIDRRPVLFVDNLDLIVDALKPGEQWALRRVLQAPHGPVLIGAATHFLTQSGDREATFYEFFHPHVLEPLTEAELMQCIRALAELRGDAGEPIRQILKREPERLRTLYDLTGGNPRVLALIYQLLERRESGDVFADLEALLDQVSPYYKARVEEYATAQQRSVIDAIALNWDPITSHDLSATAGIEITTTSSHLNRMKRDGFIEEVPTSGARSGYQLAERFLNIWYLMRHGTRRTKQRLLWLAKFLSKLYGAEELGRMALEAQNDAVSCAWRPEYREAVIAAYEESRTASQGAFMNAAADRDGERVSHRVALATVTRKLEQTERREDDDVRAVRAVIDQAIAFSGSKDFTRSVEILEAIVERFGASSDSALQECVAVALVSESLNLGELGRREDAITASDDLLARFGASPEPRLYEWVASAMLLKGMNFGDLNRYEEAIAAYDEVVAHFGASPDLAPLERVAWALVSKGAVLGALGRREDAIATYDEAVARFGASTEPGPLEMVARALVNKGVDLGALDRREEAIVTYDEVVVRFGASSEPGLREQVAMALVNKGVDLGALDRREEANATYDEVVVRFGASSETALHETVAKALINKGRSLRELDRHEEAIAVFDEVVARFGASTESTLLESVATALVSKGHSLGDLDRREDAIVVYDDVIARFGTSTEPALLENVARALVSKGYSLGGLDRREDTIAVYDDVIARFGTSSEPGLDQCVASALLLKGLFLSALGRREDAIAAYDDVVARFGASSEAALFERVEKALAFKGANLSELGRLKDAIAAYDEVVARFSASTEPAMREAVHEALWTKGNLLFDRLGDPKGAESAYRDALNAAAPSAMANANFAWLLLMTDRADEARTLRAKTNDLGSVGTALLDAGLELASDNFGSSVEHVGKALNAGLNAIEAGFFDDLLRFLRLAEARGYGDRLVAWFESSGNADKYAPIHAAFVAYVRGERFLLDVNPEVRRPARDIFVKLTAPRRNAHRDEQQPKAKSPRRPKRKPQR